ncbi:hypothetical protein AOCH_006922 [Aspergillus ochraceoroseus]|uniref:Rhodopsin domain-containing protein n=2 Tax=Aspergillus ochraceoroseus TaxID=138278 RepID=A0A0F8WS05_9EURO|nr:hypothetical protein AOCH_006922 [Aspergillus ochraceoroseus]
MSTPPKSFPPGISPPLTLDNADNHSGVVVVITSLFLVLTVAAFAARAFSAYQRHNVQRDDYIFTILVIIASIQASVVLLQVHFGWGARIESISDRNLDRVLKIGYTADIFAVVVVGFSKITTCLFYEALFSKMMLRFIRTILAGMIVWTVCAMLLVGIRCGHTPWNDIGPHCSVLFNRLAALTSVDFLTEILLCVYSGLIIWKLKLSAQKKLLVLLALECRIVLIPLAAIHLYYMKKQFDAPDPILHGAYATVATELYLLFSVLSLVTTSLKSFLAVYVDQTGISYTDGTSRSATKSATAAQGDTLSSSHRAIPYSCSAGIERGKGWERMEDPDAVPGPVPGQDPPNRFQILKTVQLSIRDEPIELLERRNANL